ncbi:MAG: glycosyltransferase family A protein [Bacteroidia bacterium]|nr:glycosyltransferase family A protein [Bacteroidia bacterium]
MKTLTIFTSAYNRAHTLGRTYESLCRQTCDDFEWLVIDDGSTDNTEELVKSWLEENKIPIRYIQKENGGLHTGYATAIANMNTELNVCIDSDDYMPDDAVEIIVKTWDDECREKGLAGIIGLDYYMNGGPIGGLFKYEGDFHFYEIRDWHVGDDKKVCRTDLLKALEPMKSLYGEKNFNPIYYYTQVDEKYKFKVINENLCFVDYQPDGMAATIFKQYRNSPHSFAQLRRLYMSMSYETWPRHFRNAIHYVSSCIFAKERDFIKTSPRPFTTILAIPFGILLNLYIRYKTSK